MNEHNDHLTDKDEGRNDGTESKKRKLAEETEMERMEERFRNLQRQCSAQSNLLEGEALRRWREDAMGLTDELHRFLLRKDQHEQHLSFESTGNSHDHIGNDGKEGAGQWFQRSQPTSTKVWKKQLEFFELCYYLKCNHPEIHQMNIFAEGSEGDGFDNVNFFPDGRLRYLGNAMMLNTHITELVVDVSIMTEEDDDIRRATTLIEFVRTSTGLRKVGICKRLLCTNVANRFAGLILDAMTANASIQELEIKDTHPIDAFHKLLSTSTSLKKLHIDCEDFDDIDSRHRDRVLYALAENRSVDHLSFTVGDMGWVWLEEIPLFMGQGPAKVRTLILRECGQFAEPFYDLMSTTSLGTLEMDCVWEILSSEDLSMLHSALAENESIENLKLIARSDEDWDIVDQILLHLHNGPSTLQKLTLSLLWQFDALRQYLCRTTATLQHLVLEECVICDDSMNCLTQGLQERDSNPSTVMTQVALKSCRVNKESMNQLVEFITARSKSERLQHRLVSGPLLLREEPDLLTTVYSPPETKNYPHLTGDVMIVSMSTIFLSPTSSGISSDHPLPTHCVTLSMCPYGSVPAYDDVLMTNTEASSIACLQLSRVGPPDSLKLALGLPRLMSLSSLHLVDIHDDVVPANVLKGVRQNGSLLTTSFLREGQRPFFQDRRDRILVESYCQRNRFLSEMILTKMAICNVLRVDVEMTLNNDATCNTLEDNSCTNNDQQVLLPKLFRVANVIPLTRPRLLLVAVLELDMTIGPQERNVPL